MAHFARNKHVGQKVHRYLDYSVALAVLAPPARNVKGKSSASIPAFFRVRGGSVKFAYRAENARICRGIGPRRSPYRRLVYVYNLVEVLHAVHAVATDGKVLSVVDFRVHARIKRFVDERTFAASAYARNYRQKTYRERHGYPF